MSFHRSGRTGTALSVAGAAMLLPSLALAAPAEDLVGEPMSYVTREEDTLLDVAHDHDLGYVEVRAANPGIDPWLPGAGKTLVLPTVHILPAAPRQGIVINLPELRLYYYGADGAPRTFPLGIGGEGKETPVGQTRIARKMPHPPWIPTKSERQEDPDLPEKVEAGPDNPMGDYALYLGWTGYAIHGTNKPYSIGRRDSHGCIRMYPDDIETLYRLAPAGTMVTVVNQQAKAGWSGGELYLEIHPDQSETDELETRGAKRPGESVDADDLAAAAAGDDATRLDWYAIHLAEEQRTGVPVRITLPVAP